MITPSYAITATERILPAFALDFTTASIDPRVSIARAGNTATVVNSSGVIVDINADLPRFDFDPITLTCRGLLIEEARTNALLNSLIDGTDLATQSVTVTAAARTLSFYGDGEIVLSGAASATVTGTGAYPARRTFTFTPSAGSLTLTVSGAVKFAQLETGSFATSFIPTGGAAVTRNADVATVTGANFIDFFNPTEGTFVAEYQVNTLSSTQRILYFGDGTNSNRYDISIATNGRISGFVASAGSSQGSLTSVGAVTPNDVFRFSYGYKVDDIGLALNAESTVIDLSATLPIGVDQMKLGNSSAAGNLSGYIRKVMYYPHRLTNAEIQAFSK